MTFLPGCAPQADPHEDNPDASEQYPTAAVEATVSLSKSAYQPGEQIDVKVMSEKALHLSAWVGVLPPHIEHGSEDINDQHDLDAAIVSEDPLYLVAPRTPGTYEVRLHDFGEAGKELDFVEFEVLNEPIKESTIGLEKRVFYPKERVDFHFTAPPEVMTTAWIGVIPSGIPHGNEMLNNKHQHDSHELAGRTKGTGRVVAPYFLGKYDLRLHESNAGGGELCHATFEVIPRPAGEKSPNP